MESLTRDRSIDLFRGLTLALMLVVNNPGSWGAIFAPLRHAAWHGYTPTDMVFPFFLIAVGLSIGIKSTNYKTKKLWPRPANIWLRAGTIFSLGVLLNSLGLFFPKPGVDFFSLEHLFNFDKLRLLGVLQRISICYLVWALLLRKPEQSFNLRFLIKWNLIFILVYKIVMLWPGEMQGYEKLLNNARGIDLFILTEAWMYNKVVEPEGIVSTLGALVTTGLGILLYFFLSQIRPSKIKLVTIAFCCLLMSHILALIEPINKQLWTISYAVNMQGWAILTIVILKLLLNIQHPPQAVARFGNFLDNWLSALGKNPILVYVISSFVGKCLITIKWELASGKLVSLKGHIYSNYIQVFAPEFAKLTSLLYALGFLIVFSALAFYLDRRSIYVRI